MSLPHRVLPLPESNGQRAGEDLLLCFSHLRWDFVFQRPQHLLTRAARSQSVVFIEEPVMCATTRAPALAQRRVARGVTVAVPMLPAQLGATAAEAAQRMLLDGLLLERAPRHLTTWFYTPMALTFAGHVEANLCVYDCMDELSGFKGASPHLAALERRLLRQANLVFTGGHSLFAAKQGQHPSVHAFPSSIDAHHFLPARGGLADPDDQSDLKHPRLGYFGVIDERMDMDLLAAMAQARPDWQFVMLGPVVKIDPATLPRNRNIAWLGARPYAELPAYLANWDIGLMPFALNDATRFISPTKTPEFLAAGLPVVSSPIADVVRPYGEQGLVEIAQGAQASLDAAERLLARPRAAWLAKVDRHLATMSWDRTWAAMARLLAGAPGFPPLVTAAPSGVQGGVHA